MLLLVAGAGTHEYQLRSTNASKSERATIRCVVRSYLDRRDLSNDSQKCEPVIERGVVLNTQKMGVFCIAPRVNVR